MTRVLVVLMALAVLVVPAGPAWGAVPPPALDQLRRADGVLLVPDRFLRAWDAVTVFFPRDVGPAGGGAEDAPERHLAFAPPHPGAWTWLDARTLQFRPAEPWVPLRRQTITLGDRSTTLIPLLPVPVETAPADDSSGIVDLDRFTLMFASPVDPEALARLLSIEVRPAPGVGAEGGQILTASDFTVRPADRAGRKDRQAYVVALREPIADAKVAILRLRLADAAGLDEPIFELRLRSAVPFAITGWDCANGYNEGARPLLRCAGAPARGSIERGRGVRITFSAPPEGLDVMQARQMLRITPPVEDLMVTPQGTTLLLTGRFGVDTIYELRVDPGLRDGRQRAMLGAGSMRFSFAPDPPALGWDASQGIVERLGPQMIPLRGHGYARADVRIHAIDPLGRDFWPFPAGVVTQDETKPPLPGNEPAAWRAGSDIALAGLVARLGALGSPSVSELVDLPIDRGGVDARFGIDAAPLLARIAGEGQPGTYLLGMRPVNGQNRSWLRVQVTDLSLTAIEEPDRVRFAVTSLASAASVAGAEIRLEGVREARFVTLARGVSGPDGFWTWVPTSVPADRRGDRLRRVVVTKGADQLVLEPGAVAPPRYTEAGWTARPGGDWLGWAAAGAVAERREPARLLCHVFTERPIYRPEEPVLIAGMVRRWQGGGLDFASGGGTAVVTGPDDLEYQIPVTLDEVGGFHVRFDAKTEATGDYKLVYQPASGTACGATSFKKEAYRLPTFEVLLTGPASAPLDAPFTVGLIARWFAGGLLSDRPITWRVTQFPHAWTPPGREGFVFSSDSRFTGEAPFRSTPVLNRNGTSDAGGAAQLTLDPTIEPTAQPREYVVEATVTGNDDLQVRATQHVVALPPFVLGLRQARYIDTPGAIDPVLLVLDAEGKPLAGLPVVVRLIRRNWNSVLQASDFAQGSAKYRTETIDETVEERRITSLAGEQALHFAAREAGVYIIEAEAADRIGRSQTLKLDLFMAGATPVTWSRPPSQTVTMSTDRDAYAPGETAAVIVQSPFQSGRALAAIEQPEGRFSYEWADVANGFARLAVPIRKEQVPRLAVHVLLMRGRLAGAAPGPTAPFDQGKPVTVAATAWIKVLPVEHQMKVAFEAPASARPGQEIDITLRLTDMADRPLAGEATVWMVDQAVLSLARERPLDPLPAFLVDRPARLAARDSRNMAFGILPLTENPGGDEVGDFGMENISVRRNFTPVPLYLPRVKFGPDGVARVHVTLPDTLTVYMLRAKAISGADRFGFGVGSMRIRQPLVAQPALPRFVRPGDRFDAAVVARVVEGPGGAGRALLSLDNLTAEGSRERGFTWAERTPSRLTFPVTVPQPISGRETARLRFLVQRDVDKASDAVEIELPIRPDRPAVHERLALTLAAGARESIPAGADARANSYQRSVVLAADPALVKLIGGLRALAAYPYGCTEQRLALAGSELALSPFAPLIEAAGVQARIAADVAATIQAIRLATDENGLVGFWPRTPGTVMLTAAAHSFLLAAKAGGAAVDPGMIERQRTVLTQALRSDYAHFVGGEALRERVAALAALAEGGALPAEYAAELARRATALPTESAAQAVTSLSGAGKGDPRLIETLLETLWGRVQMVNRNGALVYGGLAGIGGSARILPSETRALAELVRGVAAARPDEPRLPLLRTALLTLGDGNGWGTTNATAAALRALAGSWAAGTAEQSVVIALPDADITGALSQAMPLRSGRTTQPGKVDLENRSSRPVAALVDTSYIPAEPGAQAQPSQHGLVLQRTLYRVPATGPLERLDPGADGALHVAQGTVLEEVDELISPEPRTQVAITLPLPAGFEPLNPNIATAPAEAAPSAGPTLAPSYAAFADDAVTFVYLDLPRGSFTLRYRVRAQIEGSFTQPPAMAEAMYEPGVTGTSAGRRVVIER